MPSEESQFNLLLSQLLDGELAAAESQRLAEWCERDPGLARRLRAELEWVEWIRQAARDGAGERAFVDDLQARLASARTEGGGGAGDDGAGWIARLLDGDIDARTLEELVRRCWRDPELASRVRRELILDDLLHQAAVSSRSESAFTEALETRMWAEQSSDRFVETVAAKIRRQDPDRDRMVAIPLPANPARPVPARSVTRTRRISLIALTGGWAAAAGAVLLLGLSILYQPEPGAPVESVAEVRHVSEEARWGAEGGPVDDRYFAPGRYALAAGIVTVGFVSGAEMTVEGPAEFEVRSDREAFVHSGVALLAKNEAAESGGFTLRTGAMDLGESGETIGLVADGSSSSEAVVFDGGAEVCLPQLGFCRDLFALEAVRADLGREKLFDIPYNPGVFARTWKVNAGIESNTGAIRVALPGEAARSGKASQEVRLSVEKIRFEGNGEIEVDTLEPGQFARVSKGGGTKLDSSGRRLRSYLLEWDAATGTVKRDGEPVEASVTFDHEIVGVIYSPDRLAESDQWLGVSGSPAASRGLEAGSGQSGDLILVSDDRRTVNLKLSGDGADRLDHVRVLVALN